MKNRIDECLNLSGNYEHCRHEWQNRATRIINDYYYERDRWDDIIYDLASEEWEELVRQQIDIRGWQGLLYFIGEVKLTDDWACLDAYGNAKAVNGSDLVGILKDIKQELEDELKEELKDENSSY